MRAVSGWPAFVWKNNFLLVLVCCVAASGQHGKPAAALTCATCHAGVVNSYAHAPMRHAMEPEDSNPQLAAHLDLKVTIGRYSYRVQTRGGASTYSVTDGTDTIAMPLKWIFGQNTQTFVLEKDGYLYESRVSYFPKINGLDTTPGDQGVTPQNLAEAMGRQLPVWESRNCFRCHATGVKDAEPLVLEKLSPGVQCEHCHAGAEQHLADAQKDNFKTQPPSLKKLDAESMSTFCGQCHRAWDTVVRNRWHGRAFVRFQPYRMALSRCFTGNDPRISCVACHDPHQTVSRDTKSYDGKCLACHAGSTTVASEGKPALPMAKACPVAKENCASCHMQKIDLPGGHAQFTDHYIRIVKPGEPYPY